MRSPAPTSRTASRSASITEPPLPRALREDDVHRADRRRARGVRARRARPACARRRGRPRGGWHAHRHLRHPPPEPQRGADRRHLLRRGDQEVDLHGDERPASARGHLPDALLRERRRARPRRDLLRPLRDRQDDAFGRSRAVADRRRRARLGRQRRLQHRGRLLREGDPPLAGGRARDLPDDAHVRDDPRERRRSTRAACSTSTTTRRPRTRARPTSSSRSRTRSRRSRPGTRAR